MFQIDAHQHFWSLDKNYYGWLSPALTPIYRDFLPNDIRPQLAQTGVEKTILVQAAPTEAETLYLIDIAKRCDFVAGVVGWVDFEAADAADRVDEMAQRKCLGLRPMVQDIADTNWLMQPHLRPVIEAMIAHDLRFDALVQPRHLNMLIEFAATYPQLRIVVDHGAKPAIAYGLFQPWAADITRLARQTNVFCKLSGLVTEAATDWKAADIEPFATTLVGAFGPDRLMWGSDWPVLNLASDYASWHGMAANLLSAHSIHDRALMMGGNAARFYGI
jgi:L-fuconolactonase